MKDSFQPNLRDTKLSVRKIFDIDSDWQVPAFSQPSEHGPEIDKLNATSLSE